MSEENQALFRDYKADQRMGRLIKFGAGLALLVFGFWTVGFLEIPMERLLGMFGPLGTMLSERIFPPRLCPLPADGLPVVDFLRSVPTCPLKAKT